MTSTYCALRLPASVMLGILLLGSPQAIAQSLPDRYLGVWKDMEGADGTCAQSDWNSDRQSDTHIRISPRQAEGHEWRCRIVSVQVPQDDSEFSTVRLRSACAQEGSEFVRTDAWRVVMIRGQRTLLMAVTSGGSTGISAFQFCPASAADRPADVPKETQQPASSPPGSTTLRDLPREVRAHVEEVRNACREMMADYVPTDEMQGVLVVQVNGAPAIIADNERLCTDHAPGGNCSNRGCDLLIWRLREDGIWQQIFREHTHGRTVNIDPASQSLQSIDFGLYAGDRRCRPQPNRQYTSGESCGVTARYVNGKWTWEVRP